MGLLKSQNVKDLEHHVSVAMLHHHSVFLGSTSPEIISELVWTTLLEDARDAARQCIENGEERRARRAVNVYSGVLATEADFQTRDAFNRWLEAVWHIE